MKIFRYGYKNFNVPELQFEIQKKIISECETVEKIFEKTRMGIEEYQDEIKKIFEDFGVLRSNVQRRSLKVK